MEHTNLFHYEGEISWCPGCRDFQISKSVEKALTSLNKKPSEVVVASGIGQAAKLPHYIKANGFNGLQGFALIDILQPCVSFNKINTYQWYSQRVYKVDENYDPTNRVKAFEKSLEWGDKIPIGVLHRSQRPTYDETFDRVGIKPTVNAQPDLTKIKSILDEF